MTPKITPKDFFLHLGATIVLYISAAALINLSLSIINYVFPDALAGYFSASSIAWPISILIILVPILYVLEWLIGRDTKNNPEKKDLWVRRWRIYLTIFLTVALIGGDLIFLINTYLNGEITARFAWKVLAILLVAGAIGKYYFFSMFENWKHAKLIRKGNAWFGIVLVIAAIISGFLVVGSPSSQRALRFDEQRVNDLESIQSQIIYNYWSLKGTLPVNLDSLNDPVGGFSVPIDPETGASYEYGIIATSSRHLSGDVNASFRLCATFDRASQNGRGRGASGSSSVVYPTTDMYPYQGIQAWSHAAGHVCFDRSIDPSIHPVQKQAEAI